jgi:hypothetical protein
MEMIKKNISLVLGIAIPILMILFVAASIYLPRLFAPQPSVNFLYAGGEDYYGNVQQYTVQNNQVVKNEVKLRDKASYNPPYVEPKLFIHDVVKNESKEISFEDAQKLNLDPSVKSSDGFEIVYGNKGDDFFPFFSGRDYSTRYIKGRTMSTKLNIHSSTPYYNNNFRFLGWIKN